MEPINKVSLESIIYLVSDEETSDAKFNTYLKYARRCIEHLGVFQLLTKLEKKHTIRNRRFDAEADFFYIRSISIDGIPAYSSMEKSAIQGLGTPTTGNYYNYTTAGNSIVFDIKDKDWIEGKQADVEYKILDKNNEGEVMVPVLFQEAIISFIRKEEAFKIYNASGGRTGRGLWQDMSQEWEKLSRTAMNDAESPDENERELINLIWKTKYPLNSSRGFTNFNKIV